MLDADDIEAHFMLPLFAADHDRQIKAAMAMVTQAMRELRLDINSALDVGAYAGMFAVRCAKRGWRTVAVEPMPWSFVMLLDSIRRNKVSVRPICAAITARTERLVTLQASHETDMGASLHGKLTCEHAVIAPTIQLAELIATLGPFDLIKIDIEGHEYELFDDLPIGLFSDTSLLLIEHHDVSEKYAVAGTTAYDLTERLRSHGFVVVTQDAHGQVLYRKDL